MDMKLDKDGEGSKPKVDKVDKVGGLIALGSEVVAQVIAEIRRFVKHSEKPLVKHSEKPLSNDASPGKGPSLVTRYVMPVTERDTAELDNIAARFKEARIKAKEKEQKKKH